MKWVVVKIDFATVKNLICEKSKLYRDRVIETSLALLVRFFFITTEVCPVNYNVQLLDKF
jgi:hypothetical protein